MCSGKHGDFVVMNISIRWAENPDQILKLQISLPVIAINATFFLEKVRINLKVGRTNLD